MPRRRKKSLFPIALSPTAVSETLNIPLPRVWHAIETLQLPAYASDKRRIHCLVKDVCLWVESFPRVTARRRDIKSQE